MARATGVTRGLSQGAHTLLKEAHWPLFGNAIISSQKFIYITYIWGWASEGGQGAPGFWTFQQQKVVFLVSSGKNQISPFWPPPRKILEKSPNGHRWKNPPDAHVCRLLSSHIRATYMWV